MKKIAIVTSIVVGILLVSIYASTISTSAIYSKTSTVLFVDPPSVSQPVGSTFTIYVKVSNVVDLYGIDIKFAWDTTLLEYVSHEIHIPVEDYPDGILHEPGLLLRDDVDTTAGTYWVAYASMAPAEPFDGDGIAFEMTFEVIAVGSCILDITSSDLADSGGSPIAHEVVDGEFSNEEELIHDVAVTDVIASPDTVEVGEPVQVDVTVENEGDFLEDINVVSYYDGNVIGTIPITLDSGETAVVKFDWDTTGVSPGTYEISALATIIEGEDDDPEDNFFEDGTVTVTSPPPPPPPPPPPTGEIEVQWANYSWNGYYCGDPRYPFGGQYHNGEYPVWKNFTVINGGDESIIYIAVEYPEATPSFKPSEYLIRVIPDGQCWTITYNSDDRLIEFFAEEEGIPSGGCAIVSIKFIEGPTEKDRSDSYEFAVTVSSKSCSSRTFYLKEYIDKTPPTVSITFPEATSQEENFAFVKRNDGYIWLLLPNCADTPYEWLWINGTASDSCSGINRVEIWINGTYMGDATLSGPVGSNEVTWWWRTDPTKNPEFWVEESWYYVVARAYDNSVNDEKTIPSHGMHPKLPLTNYQDTEKHWFFWMGQDGAVVIVCDNYRPLDWVPGNGRIDVWGKTRFYPYTDVEIWLENELYGFKQLLTTVKADKYGRFYVTIDHLPEVPRNPTCGSEWTIRAVQPCKDISGVDRFEIIPWITFEDTFDQNDPTTWQTTKSGYVGDTVTVYGHGFLPSEHGKWDPYSTVYVEIVYTDVAPLEEWGWREIFNGTGQFNWDNLRWYPRLSETVLATVTTDENGYWKATIQIPQSFGGFHAIYAREVEIVTEHGKPGPTPGTFPLVKSGWPECTEVPKEAQAVIFDVWPTIAIFPSTALTDQYVTITGEGLPLPKYYELWMNEEPIVENRDWCLVLDFGPNEQWVFENKRIRNNELDLSWGAGMWYPFSFNSPDPAFVLDSPVWSGKLTSMTLDFSELIDMCEMPYQFHIGSKYLKVPILPANDYEVKLYYYNKNTDTYVYDYSAKTCVTVLKDPLNLAVEVGGIHYPGEVMDVFVTVDVDGIPKDATTLSLELYRGDTFVETLTYNKVSTGFYVATFNCPSDEGDYFIKAVASKEYECFTLYGSAAAGFSVTASLEGYMASINEMIADVVIPNLGQIQLNLSAINTRIVDIQNGTAIIQGDMGLVKANLSSLNTKILAIENLNDTITNLEGIVLEIQTSVGNFSKTLADLNGIVSITDDVATIKTEIGEIKGKVLSIENGLATIKTEIGTITVNTDSIKSDVGLQPVTIGLSLIAALAAIIAAALILRKVYLK